MRTNNMKTKDESKNSDLFRGLEIKPYDIASIAVF